jgi:hypothetical protein
MGVIGNVSDLDQCSTPNDMDGMSETDCTTKSGQIVGSKFRLYPSVEKMYGAYADDFVNAKRHSPGLTLNASRGTGIGYNSGHCSQRIWNNEIAWLHGGEQRLPVMDKAAAGRVLCWQTEQGLFMIEWTTDASHLIGIATGHDQVTLITWWVKYHHEMMPVDMGGM